MRFSAISFQNGRVGCRFQSAHQESAHTPQKSSSFISAHASLRSRFPAPADVAAHARQKSGLCCNRANCSASKFTCALSRASSAGSRGGAVASRAAASRARAAASLARATLRRAAARFRSLVLRPPNRPMVWSASRARRRCEGVSASNIIPYIRRACCEPSSAGC
jgi:hypothetical protein